MAYGQNASSCDPLTEKNGVQPYCEDILHLFPNGIY